MTCARNDKPVKAQAGVFAVSDGPWLVFREYTPRRHTVLPRWAEAAPWEPNPLDDQ